MVPWSQLRQPFLGWLRTDLISEFTHFNLAIHLSKVKQSAFPFISLFAMSRWSRCPSVPFGTHLFQRTAVWNNQKLNSCHCSSSFRSSTWHVQQQATGMSFSCRCSHFGFWSGWAYCASNSVVLEQPFMPMWLDLTTVPAGSDARHSRVELSPP